MTDCARCGDCCENIPLPERVAEAVFDVTPEELEAAAPPGTVKVESWDANVAFLTAHWTEISRKVGDGILEKGARFYRCDAFDPVARLCTAHDARPPVCSMYPFYGKGPEGVPRDLPRRCSFWIDVAPELRPEGVRPLLPIIKAS